MSEKIEKIGYYLVWFIIIVFYGYLFGQNFLFSDKFYLLSLREVDDLAFQYTLNYIHKSLARGNIFAPFLNHDYGYGVIYWFVTSIITFPFYLFGLEKWVMIIPRQMSLLYIIAALFFYGKILERFSKSKFNTALITFMAAISPILITASLRFHVMGQILFFSTLSAYFILKEEKLTEKNLNYSLICLAVASASKLNGLFISPLIGIITFIKFPLNKNSLKFYIRKMGKFIFYFVLFSFPVSFLLPFTYKKVLAYGGNILHHFKQASMAKNPNITPMYVFNTNIGGMYMALYIAYVALATYLIKIIIDIKNRKYKDLAIISTVILSTSYILLTERQGAIYPANYLLPIGLFFFFAFITLEKLRALGSIILIILSVINAYYNKEVILYWANNYKNRLLAEGVINNIKASNDILKILQEKKNCLEKLDKLQVIYDYRSVFPLTTLSPQFSLKNFDLRSIFDNIQTFNTIKPDIIQLSRYGQAFANDEQIKQMGIYTEAMRDNTEITEKLLKTNNYNHSLYEKIYDKHDQLLYIRQNLCK